MGIFDNIAWQIAQKAAERVKIPSSIRKNAGTINKALQGDVLGVASDAINKKFGLTPAVGSFGDGTPFGLPQTLIGGVSIDEYKRVFNQAAETAYARGNLWAISIIDLTQKPNDQFSQVNFFATNVQYSAYDGAGNAQNLNSGFFDVPGNVSQTEIQVTTMDDEAGSVKNWFTERFKRCFKPDGSHGLPIDYLMLVEIQHAVPLGGDNSQAYKFRKLCRAGRMDHNLDRRQSAMEEINFTLAQYDSFSPV